MSAERLTLLLSIRDAVVAARQELAACQAELRRLHHVEMIPLGYAPAFPMVSRLDDAARELDVLVKATATDMAGVTKIVVAPGGGGQPS